MTVIAVCVFTAFLLCVIAEVRDSVLLQPIRQGRLDAILIQDAHAWQDALTEDDVVELERLGWVPPARVVDRIATLHLSRLWEGPWSMHNP